MFGDVSKVKVVDAEAANRFLALGWVFLCGDYVPSANSEPGYFSLLIGWPREKGEAREH